jgi:hypothetical protein
MGMLGKPLTWVSLSALAAILFIVLLVASVAAAGGDGRADPRALGAPSRHRHAA